MRLEVQEVGGSGCRSVFYCGSGSVVVGQRRRRRRREKRERMHQLRWRVWACGGRIWCSGEGGGQIWSWRLTWRFRFVIGMPARDDRWWWEAYNGRQRDSAKLICNKTAINGDNKLETAINGYNSRCSVAEQRKEISQKQKIRIHSK